MQEKRRAQGALLCALSDSELARSILTISQAGAKICSMPYATLGYYMVTNRGGSTLKLGRKKYLRVIKKEP
jgi:hypothetical protein